MKADFAVAKRSRVGLRPHRIALEILLLWALAAAGPAEAHDKHPVAKPPPAPHASSDSNVALDSAAAERPFEMPPIAEAAWHHLHNKLVHLPLVLAPIAFLALLLARRRPDLGGLARVLAWLAALSAGAALWAGLNQASDFEGEPKEWLVIVHRNWGIATTAALTLSALLGHWPRARRSAWIMALLAVMFVGVAGFLGGLVSHG